MSGHSGKCSTGPLLHYYAPIHHRWKRTAAYVCYFEKVCQHGGCPTFVHLKGAAAVRQLQTQNKTTENTVGHRSTGILFTDYSFKTLKSLKHTLMSANMQLIIQNKCYVAFVVYLQPPLICCEWINM